jgi:hypothetical protein
MLWPFLVYLGPCLLLPILLLLLASPQVLFDGLDHFVANFRSLCKARAEVVLDLFELLAVALCVAEGDAVRPVL